MPVTVGKDGVVQKREWSELPFRVQWRTAVVHSPRITPRFLLRFMAPEGPYPIVVKIPSRHDLPIPIWIFLPPRNKIPKDGVTPVHIDFHGGGFFMGGPFEQAPFCSKVARERGCIVLCVDHALSPFREFPAALEDAEDTLAAIIDVEGETTAGKRLHNEIQRAFLPRKHNFRQSSSKRANTELRVDPTRLSLSGWSSGGSLALNLVLSTSYEGRDWPCIVPDDAYPIPVILFYPQVQQQELPADRPRPSHVPKPGKFAQGLDRNLIPLYLPEKYRNHPRANPGLVDPKQLHQRTKLFVVISGIDTLVDQIETWVKQVDEHGEVGKVEVFRAPDMQHGYANIPERMLDRKSYKTKKQAYGAMMAFWDRVAANSGHPRAQTMIDDGDKPRHTDH